VADVDALAGEVYVFQLQAGQFAGAEAGVEKGKDEGPIPGALGCSEVAAGEEAEDVVLGKGLDDLVRDLDVLDLGERVGGDVVVAEEPREEGAGFPLSAPPGDG